MEPARIISYSDLLMGAVEERDYVITPEVYDGFLRAFDDRSPIHVDADYAKLQGFRDRVMHGAILNGFVSHFVGMVFPGANSLLLAVDLRFAQPTYLGDTLRLSARVEQKLHTQQVVVMHLSFFNHTQGCIAATARVQVKVRGG